MKIYVKNAPTCFDLITIIKGACYLSFVKVTVAKKNQLELSVKIHRCGQFGGVVAYIIRFWLVYVCDTVWNKTLMRSWLVYVCDTVWNKTLMRSWLAYVCDAVWNKTLIRSWLVFVCDTVWNRTLIPNSVTDIHQPEPDNICDHTTELTTTLYFN